MRVIPPRSGDCPDLTSRTSGLRFSTQTSLSTTILAMAPAAPRRRLGTLNGRPPTARDKRTKKAAATCCDAPEPKDEDGMKVCGNCGSLIEDGHIVAEVTFEENAMGAATVQGGYIGENARHARTLGSGAYRKIGGGGERNSTQEVEANGRRTLQMLCQRLTIGDNIQSQALMLFTLAHTFDFSKGRRHHETVAACLFAACRKQQGNTILLMDIAEIIKVNVFRLGEVYKALCEKLEFHQQRIGIQHMVDVEPLIQKYCRKLEFGAKTRDVATDAVRIMKRMKRDWIITGRHPAGLCGACIILAARMNNFRRTVREVVYVAKVADVTIAKRVEEFRRTRASELTVDQFREYGTRLRHEHDPPILAYTKEKKEKFAEQQRAREAAAAAREAAEAGDDIQGDDTHDHEPDDTIGQSEHRRKRLRTMESDNEAISSGQDEPRYDADGFAIPALPTPDATQRDQQPDGDPDTAPTPRKRGRPRKRPIEPVQISPEELDIERELTENINEVLYDEDVQYYSTEAAAEAEAEKAARALEAVQSVVDTERELQIANEQQRREDQGINWVSTQHPDSDTVGEKELELEFADDPEVMHCLLSPEESRLKEQIWVTHNEDWLRGQHEKELLKRIAEATNADKEKIKGRGGKGRKKRSKIGDRSVLETAETPIETPADAASAMLKKRAPAAFSKYIDYESLARVYNQGGSLPPSEASQSRTGSVTPAPAETQEEQPPQQPHREATAELAVEDDDMYQSDGSGGEPGWGEGYDEREDIGEEDEYNRVIAEAVDEYGENAYDW